MILWYVFNPNSDDCDETYLPSRQSCVDTIKDFWTHELETFERQQDEGVGEWETEAVDPREEEMVFLARRVVIESPISKATAMAMMNKTAFAESIEQWRVTASKTGRLKWEESEVKGTDV